MRRRLIITAIVIAVIVVIGYPALLAVVAVSSGIPANVGGGTLALCPDSPNCVSSLPEEREDAQIEPLTYTGEQSEAQAALVAVLEDLPRTQIMLAREDYVYAERRSPTMRFVDDLEFVFDDETQTINVRSAARLGYSDMDQHRAHIEQIRAAFAR